MQFILLSLLLLTPLLSALPVSGGEQGADRITIKVRQLPGATFMCRNAMPVVVDVSNNGDSDLDVFTGFPDFSGLSFTLGAELRALYGVRPGEALLSDGNGIVGPTTIRPNGSHAFVVYLDRYLEITLPSADFFAVEWKIIMNTSKGKISATGLLAVHVFDADPAAGTAALKRYYAGFLKATSEDDLQRKSEFFHGIYGTRTDDAIPYLGKIVDDDYRNRSILALTKHDMTPAAQAILHAALEGKDPSLVTDALNVYAYHRMIISEKKLSDLLAHSDLKFREAGMNYIVRLSKVIQIPKLMRLSNDKDEATSSLAKSALAEIIAPPPAVVPATPADDSPMKTPNANGF